MRLPALSHANSTKTKIENRPGDHLITVLPRASAPEPAWRSERRGIPGCPASKMITPCFSKCRVLHICSGLVLRGGAFESAGCARQVVRLQKLQRRNQGSAAAAAAGGGELSIVTEPKKKHTRFSILNYYFSDLERTKNFFAPLSIVFSPRLTRARVSLSCQSACRAHAGAACVLMFSLVSEDVRCVISRRYLRGGTSRDA